MMVVVYVAVTVLSLLSVGHSAPATDCDSLLRPLQIQGRDRLLGKWIYIAQSSNMTGSETTKKFVQNVWVRFTAANESDVLNEYQVQKMFGTCYPVTAKLNLANGTIHMEKPAKAQTTSLQTSCPDCLVLSSQINYRGEQASALVLMSRRKKVTDAELQEFLKQIECQNLPSPHMMNPDEGLCPDESSSQ